MTRAKRNLELIAPLRFYVTQQRRFGERHVYGARSRFLTDAVLATLEQTAWPQSPEGAVRTERSQAVRIDAGARMRAMWGE
jgi:DNA helicase-2/ATP-dependent DNA helicase PcrA